MEGTITIVTRDCNGRWETAEMEGNYAAMKYAESLIDDDEIMFVLWNGVCIYSAMMTENAMTPEELTGFFA